MPDFIVKVVDLRDIIRTRGCLWDLRSLNYRKVMAKRDLTGETIKALKVLIKSDNGKDRWNCQCILCGIEKSYTRESILYGNIRCKCIRDKKRKTALIGLKFNKLTVIEEAEDRFDPKTSNVKTHYTCRCDCGNTTIVAGNSLTTNSTISCGCAHLGAKIKDLTGQVFGKLTVLRIKEKTDTIYKWICQCACGQITEVRQSNLQSGNTVSCGCIAKAIRQKSGKTNIKYAQQANKKRNDSIYENNIKTQTKLCTNCDSVKSFTEFGNLKSSKDGKNTMCKVCIYEFNISEKRKQYMNEYYIKNKDKLSEQSKQKYQENREEIRKERKQNYEENKLKYSARAAKNYQKNKEKIKARVKSYQDIPENKDKKLMSIKRRKLIAKNVEIIDIFVKSDIIEKYGNTCFYCDGPFEHIDHYIPIAKGGNHVLDNVRPACARCNLSKSDKMPEEFVEFMKLMGFDKKANDDR